MASPSKAKVPVSDLHLARNKLNGVLQILKQKVEDSTSTSGSSDEYYSFPPGGSAKKEKKTQRKRGGKLSRKRRRKDESLGGTGGAGGVGAGGGAGGSTGNSGKDPSYVMKLFDRSVDFAKFSATSPLYPICRSWMMNDPNGVSAAAVPTTKTDTDVVNVDDEDAPEEEQCVTVLPSPLKIPKVEDFYYQNLRIPSPTPPPNNPFMENDGDALPTKESLLSNHLLRWKEVRQKWKEASFMNEERYRDSIGIIKSLKVVFE